MKSSKKFNPNTFNKIPMRCLITVVYDITDELPREWKEMSIQNINEYVADTPEILSDCNFETNENGNIVWKVEKL